jgi:hypothetical protein
MFTSWALADNKDISISISNFIMVVKSCSIETTAGRFIQTLWQTARRR